MKGPTVYEEAALTLATRLDLTGVVESKMQEPRVSLSQFHTLMSQEDVSRSPNL